MREEFTRNERGVLSYEVAEVLDFSMCAVPVPFSRAGSGMRVVSGPCSLHGPD